MNKKEFLAKIAAMLKIDAEKLAKEFSSEEDTITVEIPELKVFGDDELTKRDSVKYKEGKTAGAEITIKEAREKHGLEFEGKNIDALIEAVTAKAKKEAGAKPTERITELETQVAGLKQAHAKAMEESSSKYNDLLTKSRNMEFAGEFSKSIDFDTTFPKDYIQYEFGKKVQVEWNEDGTRKYIDRETGKPILNPTTLDPLPGGEIIKEFALQFKKKEGGRAGGNESGNEGASSLEQFQAKMKAEGVEKGSHEYIKKETEFHKAELAAAEK